MTEPKPSPLDVSRVAAAAVLRLNEPASLNALSPAMLAALDTALDAAAEDDSVRWVVIEGAGGKAFSAGADVRAMWRHAVADEYAEITGYFGREYAIDLRLASFPKPCISLVDGLCLGGGMGIAVHSPICVATETASFAMPETLIGFFPDAGASWFLPRLPGALGLYSGLTGARITGGDAVRLGLASHYVPHEAYAEVRLRVIAEGPEVLRELAVAPPPSSLDAHKAQIDGCFRPGDGVAGILSRLEADGSAWAQDTLSTLRSRSPASLVWTYGLLSAPKGSLAECLRAELDLVAVSTRHPDFREGIRAALIDKDRTPHWAPG